MLSSPCSWISWGGGLDPEAVRPEKYCSRTRCCSRVEGDGEEIQREGDGWSLHLGDGEVRTGKGCGRFREYCNFPPFTLFRTYNLRNMSRLIYKNYLTEYRRSSLYCLIMRLQRQSEWLCYLLFYYKVPLDSKLWRRNRYSLSDLRMFNRPSLSILI